MKSASCPKRTNITYLTFERIVQSFDCIAYPLCNLCGKSHAVFVMNFVEDGTQVLFNRHQKVFIPVLWIDRFGAPLSWQLSAYNPM